MANLFKTRFVPNPDGSDSATAITNANTAFVHTYIGDDFSGDGTREYPYKSAFKANQKSGVIYMLFRGVINEAFSTSLKIIGDDINQQFITSNYTVNYSYAYKCTITGVISNGFVYNSIVSQTNITPWLLISYCLVLKVTGIGTIQNGTLYNSTLVNYIHMSDTSTPINCIMCGFNYTTAYPFSGKYIVFPSSYIFKYNNVAIVQPIWTNDSKANIQLLRNAYLAAGMTQIKVDSLFLKDSFGNETCRIVKESRNGGISANIFNRYDGTGNVLDYSLNPDSNNEALYASDLGGYVGCFGPASKVISTDLDTPINVNVDGTDDVTAGTLTRVNVDQTIDFNTASSQIWNRIKNHTTIVIPNGIKFKGGDLMSDDGSAFGYYFGKHQNLMDTIALTPADALEQNTIYKVCNVSRDIYSAIIFNGTQYLPDYFFKTGTVVLNYTLLNVGSGTIVRKVLATPMESIEVIPYDDDVTPSITFPKFSCPMFGNVQMLFHKIGVNIDKPVLFSEVANDKIAYYDDWAVTNADQEFVTLANDTVNYYYKIPVLKYLRTELNGHFNADYDQ